ncbi:MAG: insulinase family protein [Alphaproteobacteria bacterium]|nr:insulinase family protein [Alphaproteobacteria bacterium]
MVFRIWPRPAGQGMRAFAALFLLLAPGLLAGCVAIAPLGPPRFAQEMRPGLEAHPDALFGRLENGLRYVVLDNDLPKDHVSMRLVVLTGAVDEGEDERGYAHLLEHMPFRGTRTMSAQEVTHFLNANGMKLGPDANASTGPLTTQYILNLPKNDAESLSAAFAFLREVADGIALDPEDLEAEKKVVQSELRQRDTPGARASEELLDLIFPGTLYADRLPVGGSAESVGAARVETIRAFYDRTYRPEAMAVVVAGRVEPLAVAAAIEDAFGDLAARAPDPAERDLGRVPGEAGQVAIVADPALPTQVLLLTTGPAPPAPPSLAQERAEDILSLAHALLSRRIDEAARRPDAPIIAGSAGLDFHGDWARVQTLSARMPTGEWERGLAFLEQELRRALEHGFTRSELDEIVAERRSALARLEAIAQTYRTQSYASLMAGAVASGSVFRSIPQEVALGRATLDTIRLEEVDAALRAAWAGRDPAVFITGEVDIADPQAAVRAALTASRALPVAAPEERLAVAFAYDGFGPAGAVIEERVDETFGFQSLVFDNGVRANILKTPFEEGTVRVQIRIGSGRLSVPKDRPGLGQLGEYALLFGGLENQSFEELRRLLRQESVGLSFDIGVDGFVFRLSGRSGQLPFLLSLATAYVEKPGFHDEAWDYVRRSLSDSYTRLRRSPDAVFNAEVARIIRDGDPRFGVVPPEEVLGHDIAEVRDWLKPLLSSAYLEVAVVGDIDPDTARAALAGSLGAIGDRPARLPDLAEARDLRFPTGRAAITLTHEGDADKAIVAAYWPVSTPYSNELFATGELAAQLLERRARDRLRVEEGKTYGVDAASYISAVFDGYGWIRILANVDPSDIPAAIDALAGIAPRLEEEPLEEAEMVELREPLRAEGRRRREDNGQLVSLLSYAQAEPDRVATALSGSYALISRGQVMRFLETHVEGAEPLVIVVRPE